VEDVVIHARALRKVYRLYAKPSYRFRDMFGLLGDKPGAYTEHAALDDVNLDVRRGEKVAIIGRNGAGKSTLLKLVTRVIEPTSGTLEVAGDVHALLQIGTGFHPDFTGRENVHAYLAQLGVTGARADAACEEVIDFAELEEYIDQPMKTYSTGMGVRLMFSVSTAITPELLVLDEILGVGDAYFAQKSFERMRALGVRHGTTLLLVTHDVYSAVKLCERVIWIDRGRILMDGDGPSVVRAYEDSIRTQEEARLRAKKLARLQDLAEESRTGTVGRLMVELQSPSNIPPPAPIYFADISLRRGDDTVARLPLGPNAFDETAGSHLHREGGAWGEYVRAFSRPARPMLNYGSSFHKVAGVFAIPADSASDALVLHVEHAADEPHELIVHAFTDTSELHAGRIAATAGEWTVSELPLELNGAARKATPALNLSGVHGTGRVVIRDASFVGEDGRDSVVLEHGRPAALVIRYDVVDPTFSAPAQVVVVFHRSGVQDVCRYITRDMRFDGRKPKGTIRLDIPALALTDGTYSITIMIVEDGYFDRVQTVFYTINPGVYSCLSRFFEVTIIGSGSIGSGTVMVGGAAWTVLDRS
jgi:homopolymeric O-antigen transport system ATP-binding protein